jgi:hypothetical protein
VLSLHYKPRFVQENTASQVLRELLEITETILNVEDVTIEKIKENFNSAKKEVIRKSPNGETVVLNRNAKTGLDLKVKYICFLLLFFLFLFFVIYSRCVV